MTVSVVVPLYNKLRHVSRAIESVLAQTVQDFEVVVVDDGSTDGGGDVAREFGDQRIRVITQKNAGESAARNRGILEASSEFVAFVDADDAWDPDFLATVLSLKDCYLQARVWGTFFRIVKPDGRVLIPKYPVDLREDHDCLINYFVLARNGYSPLCASAVMIAKEALRSVGGFPVGVAYAGDHDTWIRLALRYEVAWSPEPKATLHEDAENRTKGFFYLGNYPFFESLRQFERECEGGLVVPEAVHEYLAWRHTGLLYSQWLAGEKSVVREIVRDCHRIGGYRLKCLFWYVLSWIPYPVVRLAWRTRRRVAGRDTEWPEFRQIRRPLAS